MRKIREVLRLRYELKLSQKKIARAVLIGQSTVCEYLSKTKQHGLSWPLPEDLDDAALEALCFPAKNEDGGSSRPLPDYQHIHQELKRKGVTLNLLWLEYREIFPHGFKYSHFCDLYREWAQVRNVWMPQQHKAGEKVFVDYAGLTTTIRNSDGTSYEAQIFVAAMGASNYTYVEATKTQQLPDWIESHVRMFSFFGGCPQCLVPDNLRSGVTESHRYEPEINRTYLEMAQHYGVAIVPARVRTPKDKSKAENAVQNVERKILAKLRDRIYFSLEELNEDLRVLSADLNRHPFQELPGCRLSTFEEIDKPQLQPLPESPYAFAEWKRATVGQNYHVNVLEHHYSVHYNFVKQKVEVRIRNNTVEVFCKNKRIAIHIRSFEKGKYTTNPEHYPPHHKAYANCTPENLLTTAKQVGEDAEEWVQTVLDNQFTYSLQREKVCSGVLRLSKSYGNSRLNAACRRGLRFGVFSCKSIESMLKTGLDRQPLDQPEAMTALPSNHEFIRGPSYYI